MEKISRIDSGFYTRCCEGYIRFALQRLVPIILYIILVLLIDCSNLIAQRPSPQPLDLPLISDLEKSLEAFYEAERDAKLIALQSGKAGDWKDLLPSVGLTYTVNNDPRPTISWSPISILNRKDARRQQQLTRQAIIYSYEILITNHLHKLRQLITDYFTDYDALKTHQETLHVDELLFKIAEERYAQNLITPREFLPEQKKILTARSSFDQFHQDLRKKRSLVIFTAKWTPTPLDQRGETLD